MPRELVYGRTITVRRGDLTAEPPANFPPSALDADDLEAGLELVRQLQSSHDALRDLHSRHADALLARDVLRRRHQLLSAFADDLAQHHGDAATPLDFATYFAEALTALRPALDRLPLDVTTEPDLDPDLDADEPDDADPPSNLRRAALERRRFRRDGEELPDDEVRVRLALELTWDELGGRVTVRTVALDEETGDEVRPRTSQTSVLVDLDWPAANLLVGLTRVARDQANGSPE